jgi:hypothetical protein
MNDFDSTNHFDTNHFDTNHFDTNHFDTNNRNSSEQDPQHGALGFTSHDLRSSSGWAIGGAVAAVVALVGLGATLVLGGGTDTTAQAAPAQPAQPAVTVTPDIDADAATSVAVPNEIAVPAAVTPAAATPADVSPRPTVEPAAATPAPAPQATPVKSEGPCPTYTEDHAYPLSLCSKGALVKDFQSLVNYLEPDFAIDGFFGPATEQAIKDIQSSYQIPQTGILTEEFVELHTSRLFHEEPGENDAVADWHEDATGQVGTARTSEPVWYDSWIYFDEAGTAVVFDQFGNERPVSEICTDIQNWIVEIDVTDELAELCDILDIRISSGD